MPIMDPEKAALAAQADYKPQPPRRRISKATNWAVLAACAFSLWSLSSTDISCVTDLFTSEPVITKARCPQVEGLVPELTDMDKVFNSKDFLDLQVARLSGAVQIPSVSFDDLGPVGEDKRWEIFYKFAEYLKVTYPRVHAELKLEVVNTHGLLYTWQGSDESLKPTLLMAHQDVVPVPDATVDAWTHPPFSGHFDGQYVWGRGSSDCKNQLTAILTSVEALLEAGFKPNRTVILSSGFDEEISGGEGAGHLAPYLLERYGKDGIAVVVDEGSTFSTVWGKTMALPGVGEKGYTDVHVTVRMPGGHSSIPPDHTSIGVLSELITLIEAHQYPTILDRSSNPYYGLLQCSAAHAPDFPKSLHKLIDTKPSKCGHDKLALEAAKIGGRGIKYLMQTSIAVDIINGGVKVNALPERVTATINHRVNIGEHPSYVHARIEKLSKEIAHKYNLTLHAFDGIEAPSSIVLSASNHTLEPAPVTPTNVDVLTPYKVLSGTTTGLYPDIVVAPGIMTGNTDTRYYWPLTKHIFRFGPGWVEGEEGLGRIHTVDERQSIAAHVKGVQWFSRFIRNMDVSELE